VNPYFPSFPEVFRGCLKLNEKLLCSKIHFISLNYWYHCMCMREIFKAWVQTDSLTADILTHELFLSYLAAQANGILYWPKRWHVCLAAFSTFWAVCGDVGEDIVNTKSKLLSCVCSNVVNKRGRPCWHQKSWCTAQRSVWCHSATLSPHGPPRRYLHVGWSLKR